MKKQILFLAIFSLAIFAGISDAFAQPYALPQGITGTQALPYLNCTTYPLHPMPGVPYTYKMTSNNAANPVSQWLWFATKDTSFIDNGVITSDSLLVTDGELLARSANYGRFGTVDTVSITWSPQILANTLYEADAKSTTGPTPTFVVGYGTGLNCADNIEVYEINPRPAFIIDIANIGNGGTMQWDQDTSSCVDFVHSAYYRSADDSLIMNYGWDTLYFEVAAANFVTSWTPYFHLGTNSLNGSQTATIAIADSYADATAATPTWIGSTSPVSIAEGDTISFGGIELSAANAADLVEGVSLWVRVIIANNSYESLTANTFELKVDGQDITNQWDMEDADCTTNTNVPDGVDLAQHIIKPRPDLLDATNDDGTVDPNDVIDKQNN
jgi:hypothetical protein